jgi:hypothetical protein
MLAHLAAWALLALAQGLGCAGARPSWRQPSVSNIHHLVLYALGPRTTQGAWGCTRIGLYTRAVETALQNPLRMFLPSGHVPSRLAGQGRPGMPWPAAA